MAKLKALTSAIAALGLTASTVSAGAQTEIIPSKLGDYIYFLEMDDYTSKMVSDRTPQSTSSVTGGCSSIRNGNLYGRNLDLTYSEIPEFVVHISGSDQRLESIGVCANPYVTTVVENITQEELMTMPNITNDGINEKGVIASVNVVVSGNLDDQSGTAPGKEKLWGPYVVRYLLDHATSAEHAIELLNEVDIVGGFEAYGLHWMIADPQNTYIVEILDGKLSVARNEYNIMTNFYLTLGEKEDSQTAAGQVFHGLPKLNDFAIGVERFSFLQDHFDESSVEEGMLELLKHVRASAQYHRAPEDRWYTDYTDKDLPIQSSRESYERSYEEHLQCYDHRDRKNPKGDWISWHTSIYDIEKRSLTLYSQEEYGNEYRFGLNS